ncbi:hypothetical protein DPMN_187082 [Dreissena polymorpha]|uniref:Uncharacterized protein n=1 Tax=Dreissena polymorpha TaxID=45954 RepID=A0A9D4DQA8_DREPO|nr:hypothetical protein DPMN_187082 [Dreissena polymorpha]
MFLHSSIRSRRGVVGMGFTGSYGLDPHLGSVLWISYKDTKYWFYPGNSSRWYRA